MKLPNRIKCIVAIMVFTICACNETKVKKNESEDSIQTSLNNSNIKKMKRNSEIELIDIYNLVNKQFNDEYKNQVTMYSIYYNENYQIVEADENIYITIDTIQQSIDVKLDGAAKIELWQVSKEQNIWGYYNNTLWGVYSKHILLFFSINENKLEKKSIFPTTSELLKVYNYTQSVKNIEEHNLFYYEVNKKENKVIVSPNSYYIDNSESMKKDNPGFSLPNKDIKFKWSVAEGKFLAEDSVSAQILQHGINEKIKTISTALVKLYERDSVQDFIARHYTDLSGGICISQSQRIKGFYSFQFANLIEELSQLNPELNMEPLHILGQEIVINVQNEKYQQAYDNTHFWMIEVIQKLAIPKEYNANKHLKMSQSRVNIFG